MNEKGPEAPENRGNVIKFPTKRIGEQPEAHSGGGQAAFNGAYPDFATDRQELITVENTADVLLELMEKFPVEALNDDQKNRYDEITRHGKHMGSAALIDSINSRARQPGGLPAGDGETTAYIHLLAQALLDEHL